MKQITFSLLISTVLMSGAARADETVSTSSISVYPFRRAAIEFELAANTCELHLDACRAHRGACLNALESPPCDECEVSGWVYPGVAVGAILLFMAGFLTAK